MILEFPKPFCSVENDKTMKNSRTMGKKKKRHDNRILTVIHANYTFLPPRSLISTSDLICENGINSTCL